MIRTANALFTPAEIGVLKGRDLSQTVCVVFDVLRATTTFLSALEQGATAIIPVCEIAEALDWKRRDPQVLLGGEREGRRIEGAISSGTAFDFGNSPREYVSSKVAGRRIISTTTNGTRALRGCLHAAAVFPAGLVNIAATARRLQSLELPDLLLIGAGTAEQSAYEDILGIGALVATLWPVLQLARCADSIYLARAAYLAAKDNLPAAVAANSSNARRLLAIPELADDVELCVRENTWDFAAQMHPDGAIRRIA